MEGCLKRFKSSTPTPSTAPRIDPLYDGVSDDLGFNFDSKKKSSSTKGSVARNRILTETWNFDFTHFPNLDSPKKSPCFSSYLDPNFEDQNSSIIHSSSKPYDPFINYLSPRPKFMRYNPNRRRRIFLQRNNKIKELKNKLEFNTQKYVVEDELSICSSQENYAQVEGDEIDKGQSNCCNDDNEEEEIEEENCSSLKGILEFLLVMAVIFLSTVYISTMNLPAFSNPVDESVWGSANGSHEDNLSEKMNAEILDGNETGLMELIQWNMSVEDDIKSVEFDSCAQLRGTESFEDIPTILQDEQYIDINLEGENVEIDDEQYIDFNLEDENVEINDEISLVEEIKKEGNGERDEHGISSSTEFDEMVTSESSLNKDEEPATVDLEADSTGVKGNGEGDENDFTSTEFDTIESSLNKNEEHTTTIVGPEAVSTGAITKQTQINPIPVKIVGFCILVAFFSLIYPKRKMTSSVVDAKIGSTAVDVERENIDKSTGLVSLIHSPVAAPNELSYNNYSARRCDGKKRKIVGTEESSNNSGSVSPANEGGGSVSYGSFTAEKIVIKKKKQEGEDGEVNIVIPTPVRRSSRLHNRGIISP